MQPGLPEDQRKDLVEGVVRRGQLRQAADQQGHSQLARQRLGRRLLVGVPRSLEVEAERPATPGRFDGAEQRSPDVVGHQRVRGAGRRRQQPAARDDPAVQPTLSEQDVDDLLVQLEDVRQQRRLDGHRIGEQGDHPVADQRRVGAEQRPGVQLPGGRRGEQVQRQVDRGPPPADVILQIAVDPLVPQVDVGRQGDQRQVELHLGQAVGVAQPAPARVVGRDLPPVGLRRRAHRAQRRLARHPVERPRRLLAAHVEPAEGVASRVRSVCLTGGLQRAPQEVVQPL